MKKYLDANQEAGKQFYMDFHQKGKITMLNLLKFKARADYSNLESIQPENETSGKEAYELYMECRQPHLEKAGSRVVYFGECNRFLSDPKPNLGMQC
ncbi:MAG: hypothetical protein AB8B56_02870 [Crocinitomicaceae bacterium]